MTKYMLFIFILFVCTFVQYSEARLKYQQNSPYSCEDCHDRKELTPSGVYFYLNDFSMKGWKPVNSKDRKVQARADAEVSMKIAELANQQNKKRLAVDYLNNVMNYQRRFRDEPDRQLQKLFDEMNDLRLDLEKEVIKLQEKAEKYRNARSERLQEKALDVFAKIDFEYGYLRFGRGLIREYKKENRKDKTFKDRYKSKIYVLQEAAIIRDLEELFDKECYLSLEEKLDELEKENSVYIKRKAFFIRQRMEDDGDILLKMIKEELSEQAYADFEKINLLIERKTKKRKVLIELQELIREYARKSQQDVYKTHQGNIAIIYLQRAQDLYERVINNEFDLR